MTKEEMIQELITRNHHQPRVVLFDAVSNEEYARTVRESLVKGQMEMAGSYDADGTFHALEHEDSCQVEEFIAGSVIKIPVRATKGSMGYDIFSPFSFWLEQGQSITIPTGIRAAMDPNWGLLIGPKSGKGSRYRVMMRNTIALIDSDYFFSENEGHIILNIINDNYDGIPLKIRAGESIMQGWMIPYGIAVNDNATAIRNGGFGSTVQ